MKAIVASSVSILNEISLAESEEAPARRRANVSKEGKVKILRYRAVKEERDRQKDRRMGVNDLLFEKLINLFLPVGMIHGCVTLFGASLARVRSLYDRWW